MVEFISEAPMKILIDDFKSFGKIQDKCWVYRFDAGRVLKNISKVHIQGEIIKTAGFSNEILIVDDGTGKAKVTRGSQIPGDLSWISSGFYCSVIGTLIENGKLPLIVADKIAKITNKILMEMWPWEVSELKDVLVNKCSPILKKTKEYLRNEDLG